MAQEDEGRKMVWASGLFGNSSLGDRVGLRAKYFGEEWEKPFVRHIVPDKPARMAEALQRCGKGELLTREEFPEAVAVYDEKRFKKMGSVFFGGGGFATLKQDLAEIFSQFNLGGGLIPALTFQEDEVTPYPGKYYFLHIGAQKNSLLPQQSRNLRPSPINPLTNKPYLWSVKAACQDGDIAMSSAALEGPDLWAEKIVRSQLFMSDGLAEALLASESGPDWRLKKCRIVEQG